MCFLTHPLQKLFNHNFLADRIIVIYLQTGEFRFQLLGDFFGFWLTVKVVHFAWVVLDIIAFQGH